VSAAENVRLGCADYENVRVSPCELASIEIAALRGGANEIASIAQQRGVTLPPLGQVAVAPDHLTLCVRPDRWLVLSATAATGGRAADWQASCHGIGACVDLSSALRGFLLAGPATQDVLARGCRLDLDPQSFATGRAAATIMVQVSIIVARLASGVLLLTPSTTARHVHEWLLNTARPFGLAPPLEIPLAVLCGDPLR
jgi:sarcosine oxidase subunit gamma